MSLRLFLAAALALTATPALAQDHHGHAASAPMTIAEGALKAGVRTFELAVTGDGFVPARLKVQKGEKVRLVVTRRTEKTCATEIVIEGQGIEKPLPMNEPVTVEFVAQKSGEIHYACKMGHVRGVVFIP
jgi:plastocyanin domain-containing protein